VKEASRASVFLPSPPADKAVLLSETGWAGGEGLGVRGLLPCQAPLINRLLNRFDFLVNLGIPEADRAPRFGFQEARPPFIGRCARKMSFPVYLDDDLAFHTREIHDERADRVLPAKLEPSQRSV